MPLIWYPLTGSHGKFPSLTWREKNMYKTTKLRDAITFALVASTATLTSTGVVYAQESTTDLDRIEVTGSRIKRAEIEGPSPITVITRADIEVSGELSVADFLRNNVFNSYGSARESSGSASGSFSSFSMRGLGSQYTLVLLDGRRMTKSASQDGAAANINLIPTAAVDRIEILREGAGAIYGADAIGGVINVILRKDYEGLTVSAGYEAPSGAGPSANSGSLAGGISSDRGNVTFVIDHAERDLMYNRDILPILADHGFSASTPGLATAFLSAFNAPANFFSGTTGLVGAPNCENYENSIRVGAVCRFNHMMTSANEASLRRNSLLINANYELTDNTNFFFRGISSDTRSLGVYASAPVDSYPTIAASNPFNPFGVDGTLYYRFTPLGTRDALRRDSYRDYSFGLEGRNDWFGGSTWQVHAGHGRVSLSSVNYNYGIASVLQDAIDSGTFNPFDPTHPSVAANAASIGHTVYVENEQRTVSAGGNIGFDLFEIGGRASGFVVGFDYFDDRLSFQYDSQSAAGNVFGSAGAGLGGERASYAVYFESLLPLHDTLNVSVAGRYDSYNDVGSKFTPRVSLEFRPLDSLLLRGSWGQGFRAPTMGDLYGAPSSTNLEIPPLASAGLPGGDQLACVALTAYRTASGNATYQPYPVDPCGTNAQYQFTVTSNTNVKPEESTNWGAGIVWSATDNLSIAVDYYDIEIENVIATVPRAMALAFGNEGRPSYGVTRGPSITTPTGTTLIGPAQNILLPVDNGAVQRTTGVDLDVNYRFEIGSAGTINTKLVWTHVLTDDFTPIAADTLVQAGSWGMPDDRAQLFLGWERGDVSTALITNYIGGHSDGTPGTTIPSWTTFDAQVNLNLPWNGRVSLGVRNLTNKMPPFNVNYGSPFYDNELYNIYGRVPYIRYEQNF